MLLFLYGVSCGRGAVATVERPTAIVLLEEFRDELVGPDAGDDEDTHRYQQLQDREDYEEIVVDPRVQVFSGESRQASAKVVVKLVLPETKDGKERYDEGEHPDAQEN